MSLIFFPLSYCHNQLTRNKKTMADMMGALAAGGALALGAMFARGHGRATHAVAGPAPQPAMARQAKAEADTAAGSWDEGLFTSVDGGAVNTGAPRPKKAPPSLPPLSMGPETLGSDKTGVPLLVAGQAFTQERKKRATGGLFFGAPEQYVQDSENA